jgi:hypothetical protein
MRYEIVVTALILAAAIITLCMINRPDYEPVSVPESITVPGELVSAVAPVIFYELGREITLWSSTACPEPMIVGEFCFSPAAGKMYVGVGSMRMPISTTSLVEYWEKYHR